MREASARFNEADGIHRRKQATRRYREDPPHFASMRPPEFTGGNSVEELNERAESWALQ